jgi:hypothetical protein
MRNGTFSLHTRAGAELANYLKDNYNLLKCNLCKEIIIANVKDKLTKIIHCQNSDCNSAIHGYCYNTIVEQVANAKCSDCNTVWLKSSATLSKGQSVKIKEESVDSATEEEPSLPSKSVKRSRR